jgi:predicted nucleotidyltransferase
LEQLLDLVKRQQEVIGVLLVGSGAKGFPDRWCDIDLAIVVAPEEQTPHVRDTILHAIKDSFNILSLWAGQYEDNNFISVILLTNFLEIDLGVMPFSKLAARRESWKVLFERTSDITNRMNETNKARTNPDPRIELDDSLNSIGHYIRCAVTAIQRGQPFRAAKEIEEIRNEAVRLWAMREKKIAKHFRDVDGMDKDFRSFLGSTYHGGVEIESVKAAFVNAFSLYFWVVENIHNSPRISLLKNAMESYLKVLHLSEGIENNHAR